MSRHVSPSSEEEGLFSRWSRRKQSDNASKPGDIGEQGAESPHPASTSTVNTAVAHDSSAPDTRLSDTESTTAVSLAPEASIDDTDEATVIELPDPESLSPDADISAFMQSGVDPALRQRALRKIFLGGEHSLRDGLDDYDQDFSNMRPLAEGVAETLRRWTHKVEEHLESLEDADIEASGERGDTTLDTPDAPPLDALDGDAVDDTGDGDDTGPVHDDSPRHSAGPL